MIASPWKTGLGLILLLSWGGAIPAQAQLFPSRGQLPADIPRATIAEGVILPTRYTESDAETILLEKTETVPLTLTVSANLRDRNSRMLIPYQSEIKGELTPVFPEDEEIDDEDRDEEERDEEEDQPEAEGVRFVAEELIIGDRTIPIEGHSEVITRTETIDRGADSEAILKGAAIGAAAAAALGAITGSVDVVEVLGGAGAGALGGVLLGRKRVELFSIDPDEDLDVVLASPLNL